MNNKPGEVILHNTQHQIVFAQDIAFNEKDKTDWPERLNKSLYRLLTDMVIKGPWQRLVYFIFEEATRDNKEIKLWELEYYVNKAIERLGMESE